MYVKYIFSRIKPKKNPKSPAQTTALKFKKKEIQQRICENTKKKAKRALFELTEGLLHCIKLLKNMS